VLFQNYAAFSAGIAIALFFAMLLFLELGRRVGLRQAAKNGTAGPTGVGVVDGAVFGLFSLLLGFTFSGATTRFDGRRALIIQEVNAIGTAWDRIDVLPAEPQPAIRAGFRTYMDALVATFTDTARKRDPFNNPASMAATQKDIWSQSVAATITADGDKARMLLLPALNEMFGAVERERLARRSHPPIVIYVMLGLAALASSLFGGYALSKTPKRNWMYIVGVAATVSVTAYVILELETPRLGVIQVDANDLAQLRATMK
jgi:hypothetical protein